MDKASKACLSETNNHTMENRHGEGQLVLFINKFNLNDYINVRPTEQSVVYYQFAPQIHSMIC